MVIKETFRSIVHELDNQVELSVSGASSEEIEMALQLINTELPSDVIELYKLYDGERKTCNDEIVGLFGGYEFLSIAGLMDRYALCVEDKKYYTEPEGGFYPKDTIVNKPYDLGWIPFAAESGNYLAIDTNPNKKGVIGQIISFGVEDIHYFLVAQSMTEFLNNLLNRYKNKTGNINYFPDGKDFYRILIEMHDVSAYYASPDD